MSFEEAIATQPVWIQMWLNWMALAIVGTFIALLFSKTTRRDSVIILISTGVIFLAMNWLYQKIGYVRLLGLVHVIIWTPLVYYFWKRLKNANITTPFRQIIWVFMATIVVSLLFDYVDVVRYALGERASLIPG